MTNQAIIRNMSQDEVKKHLKPIKLAKGSEVLIEEIPAMDRPPKGAFLLKGKGEGGCAFVSDMAAADAEQ